MTLGCLRALSQSIKPSVREDSTGRTGPERRFCKTKIKNVLGVTKIESKNGKIQDDDDVLRGGRV